MTTESLPYEVVMTDVLLVDFSDSIRSTLADILRIFGYSVLETDNAETAIKVVNRSRIGMIVLELDLPTQSSVQLLDSIANPPPVVLFSARPVEAEEWEQMKHKVVRQIRKPARPEVLIEMVRTVLRDSRGEFRLA